MSLHIGFTGTRHGMTFGQRVTVANLVSGLTHTDDPELFAHHGDCVGADSEFHNIASEYGARVIVHPGPDGEHRAYRLGFLVRDPLTHFARNRVIVAESDVMIATPYEAVAQQRGGTWYTIGHTLKTGKPLAIVFPAGDIEWHGEAWPSWRAV